MHQPAALACCHTMHASAVCSKASASSLATPGRNPKQSPSSPGRTCARSCSRWSAALCAAASSRRWSSRRACARRGQASLKPYTLLLGPLQGMRTSPCSHLTHPMHARCCAFAMRMQQQCAGGAGPKQGPCERAWARCSRVPGARRPSAAPSCCCAAACACDCWPGARPVPSAASPPRLSHAAGAHAAPHSAIAPAPRTRAEAASVRHSGAGAAAGAAVRACMPLGAHAAAPALGAGGGVRRRLAGERCGTPGLPCGLRSAPRTITMHAREPTHHLAHAIVHRSTTATKCTRDRTTFERLCSMKQCQGWVVLGQSQGWLEAYPGTGRGGACAGARCAALRRNQLATALHCGAGRSGASAALRRLAGCRPSLLRRPYGNGTYFVMHMFWAAQ